MTANPDLERHPLRRRILATLDREQSLSELAASLRVTDARLLWHLERLEAAHQVSPAAGR
jgi:predicted ArsR family transcriptional regulator